MNRPRRFLPPIAGGEKKTGWEALEKWVGGGGEPAPAEAAAPAGEKKTGWEALDKWVGSGDGGEAPSAEASAANGAAAAEEDVSAAAPASASGGGFMGFLKRLFGGK